MVLPYHLLLFCALYRKKWLQLRPSVVNYLMTQKWNAITVEQNVERLGSKKREYRNTTVHTATSTNKSAIGIWHIQQELTEG